MLEIRCPYDEISLKIAYITLEKKLLANENTLIETTNAIGKKFRGQSDNAVKNLADKLGVSSADLINSPNYPLLMKEHSQEVGNSLVSDLRQVFHLSDKEAWAMIHAIING